MIRVDRLQAPQVLLDNAAIWTAEFLASGAHRPSSKRYRHRNILSTLVQMTHGKCMYCEAGTAEAAGVVEHRVDLYVPVAVP